MEKEQEERYKKLSEKLLEFKDTISNAKKIESQFELHKETIHEMKILSKKHLNLTQSNVDISQSDIEKANQLTKKQEMLSQRLTELLTKK